MSDTSRPSQQKTGAPGPPLRGIPFRNREAVAVNLSRIRDALPAGLFDALTTLVAEVPDPDSALNLFERLLSTSGEDLVNTLDRSRVLLHYALVVFGYSNYLGETLIHNPDLFHALGREGALDRSHSLEEFREGFARFRSRSFETETAVLLARFKRREYVRIMLRDVLGIATLAETTGEISTLADVMVEEALREAEAVLRNRYGPPQHKDIAGRVVNTQSSVLSLGKLGGDELNYSSDIDLLFLYDDGPAEQPGESQDKGGSEPRELDNREWFIRLAQHVTELLSRLTPEGFTFRVDLRLRPQGGEGEPAVGLRHAIRYYAETAQDWERQAMIKVRHSAGDLFLSRMFIRGVQRYVYTEAVNFTAIETALETRDRISRRRAAAARGDNIDVKLDRGGIRDIEFLVQCLQRVYGGKEPWLRSGGTLFSLSKLHDKAHISGKDFHELTSAYQFLRVLEHRLQLRQGQQTQRLPQSEEELAVIARAVGPVLAGQPQTLNLVDTVRHRMAAVGEIYGRIIHQQHHHQQHQQQERETPATESSLPLLSGERSERQILERLAADAPEFYSAIVSHGNSVHTRRNLLRFLTAAFTDTERYQSVLKSPPALLRALDLFRLSDFLTDILARYPEELETLEHIQPEPVIDSAAGRSSPSPTPDVVLAWIGSANLGYGQQLAMLRDHYRHCVFASGARDLLQPRRVYVSLEETSAAAEASVAAALSIAGHPPGFAVLALGRLGTREFDLLSDADLLFLRDESLDAVLARQTAQRIVQVLSSYTREGTIFPVDARLRPHGGEGELVITPAQLETYFHDEAQPWEALTFTKLRHIAGSEQVSARAVAGLGALTERFASDPGFVDAVVEMRARIEGASAPKFAPPEAHSYDRSLKSGPGGIYDTDFLVGTLLVKHGILDVEAVKSGQAAELPPVRGNLRDRLCSLERRGLLSAEDSGLLQHATEFLRAVDHAIRLATGRKSLLASEGVRKSTAELASRFLGGEVGPDLFQRLGEVRMGLRATYQRLMEGLRTA